MSQTVPRSITNFLTDLALLSVVVASVGFVAAWWIAAERGNVAYLAAAAAVGVVLVSASLALAITFLQSTKKTAAETDRVSGVLVAMLVRTMLPLGALVFASQSNGWLATAGFGGILVLTYLTALSLETWLSLKYVNTKCLSVELLSSLTKQTN